MEMKKIILAVALVGLLTSCGNRGGSNSDTTTNQPNSSSETTQNITSSESVNSGTQTDSKTSSETTTNPIETETTPVETETTPDISTETTTPDISTDTQPDIPEVESYKVNIKNTNEAVTLTSDKAKAVPGELVTITAKVNNDNYAVTSVLFDGNVCTKVNDTTFTFVMPDHPVFITCSLAVVKGDVKLVGGITAVFEKEGSIYAARNVVVPVDTEFNLVVSDHGEEKNLSIVKFDRTKTFANIGFTQPGNPLELKIDGGATYDFFYDPANGERPCYVVRTKIDQLPTSPDGLYKLFNGQIGTETSVLPHNLLSTTFSNTETQETLTWNRYKDNSSLTEVSKLNMSGERVVKSFVYNKIEDDKLTVVDTFAPGLYDYYKDNNVWSHDTKVFSGEYKISQATPDGDKNSEVEFVESRDFVNPLVAQMVVDHSPVTMEAYESEVMNAYRVGYKVEGECTQANANVTSNRNSDGSFVVNLSSSRTIDSTNDRGSSGSKVRKHYEYRVKFTFTEAGALLNSNYAEKSYAEGEYDFDRLQFVTGSVDTNWENNGMIVKQLHLENTFGEPTLETSNFDASKYLVQSISNIKIVNPEIKDKEGNRVNLGDTLDIHEDPEQSIVTFDVLPETALNKRQYRVIDSSDKEVIGQTYSSWSAKKVGSSDITIGIRNGLGATGKANVSVYCTYMLRSVYLYNEYNKYPHQTGTNTAIIYTNNIMPYRIQVHESGKNKVVPMPNDMAGEFIGESYGMKIVFDHARQLMFVDATNTTAVGGESVQIKITSAIYDPSWIRNDIIFTLSVRKAVNPNALVGEWKITGTDEDRCFFTTELADTTRKGYDEARPYKGKLVCLGVTYEFDWGFDPLANNINVSLVDEQYYHSLLDMVYNDETDTLSIIFVIKKWTNPPTPDEEILGYESDEGVNTYIDFNRVGDTNAQ